MTAVQDQIAALTQQSQDAMSGALRTWAQAVERLTGMASGTGPVGSAGVPGAVPDLTAMVAASFDMAEQVLATQRELTLALVRTMTAVLPGGGER